MFARSEPSQLRPPPAVLDIVGDLEKAGYEAWCVGGAVRDALLGQAHLDWDLATDATPDQVRAVFGRRRTIPVGVEFGTVGVLDGHGILHEITTFRRDVRTDGRHAEVEFGASLDEDLARRDFTINSIAFSPSKSELRDPFGGRHDLEAGIIRAVGNPRDRMREDRLRALRALRFAARYNFAIEPSTWEAIRESSPHLTRLSAERVKQELEKTMEQVRAPSAALRLWRDSGALSVLVPELSGVGDDSLNAVDEGALPGLPRRPGRRLGRFAILFSDVQPNQAFAAATRLRFSKHDALWIRGMTERWQRLGLRMAAAFSSDVVDDATLRRWIADIGRLYLAAFFRLAGARFAAQRRFRHPAPTAQALHSLYRRSISVSLHAAIEVGDLAVDGDDLRQAGITPGPGLGKILSALLVLVLEDPRSNTRDRLLTEARRLQEAQSNAE